MTRAAPSFPFFPDNKLNATERGAADVIFERGTEIRITLIRPQLGPMLGPAS